jgi:hypothetical protein
MKRRFTVGMETFTVEGLAAGRHEGRDQGTKPTSTTALDDCTRFRGAQGINRSALTEGSVLIDDRRGLADLG